MQGSVVTVLCVIALATRDPVQAKAAAPIPYTPTVIAAAGATPPASQAQVDGAFTISNFAAYGSANFNLMIGSMAQSQTGTRYVYQGPQTDARATFSSCKYYPNTTYTIPVCECFGFIFDPTNLKLSISTTPPAPGVSSAWLQPGYCADSSISSPGVTCIASTPADAAGGCGASTNTAAPTSSGNSTVSASSGAQTAFHSIMCLAGAFWMKHVAS